jgi:hypothetical protein
VQIKGVLARIYELFAFPQKRRNPLWVITIDSPRQLQEQIAVNGSGDLANVTGRGFADYWGQCHDVFPLTVLPHWPADDCVFFLKSSLIPPGWRIPAYRRRRRHETTGCQWRRAFVRSAKRSKIALATGTGVGKNG